VFDILGRRVVGAQVLDLFAGSGALGIEALSRGAARVVFVERSRRALLTLEKNLLALGLTAQAEVVCAEVNRFLRQWRGPVPFDVILADPPYDFAGYEGMLSAVTERGLLSSDGILVLEHRKGLHLACAPPVLQLVRTRELGATTVSFFVMRGEAHENGHLPRYL